MGPSALSSMLAPATNVPAAMTTWSSYPGMSQGSGRAMLSTGLAVWMPWQKATRRSGVCILIAWMMSARRSVDAGEVSRPRFSKIRAESTAEESFEDGLLEYPQYTKPRSFEGMDVPEVLLSGHAEKIRLWRLKESLRKTMEKRPDLLANRPLSKEEQKLLEEVNHERMEGN